jgi:hypothetical protein
MGHRLSSNRRELYPAVAFEAKQAEMADFAVRHSRADSHFTAPGGRIKLRHLHPSIWVKKGCGTE